MKSFYLWTMSVKSILSDIKNKKFSPVYFLYGSEPYYIDQVSKAIDGILDEGEKAFNQVTLYGREVDFKQVMDHARQFPMMASHRVVILKEAQAMRSLNNLVSYLENPAPQTILCIAYKKDRLDKRTKFGQAVTKHAVVVESKQLYQNKVAAWVEQYVQDKSRNIHPKASSMLAEYIGADLAKLSNELDKIMLNLKDGEDINYEMIIDQVGINRDFNVFEFREALGKKDVGKSMAICKYFGDNPKANPIPMLLPSLFAYFMQVFQMKALSSANDQLIARSLGVNPFFVKDYKSAARNFSVSQLKSIFRLINQADLLSKGVGARRMSEKAILQDLVFGILQS